MNKLIAFLGMLCMIAMPLHSAKAQVAPVVTTGAGFGAGTVAWWSGFAAFALLPVVVVYEQDKDPWGMFAVHEESFPKQKDTRSENGMIAERIAVRSHKPYYVTVNGVDTIRSD